MGCDCSPQGVAPVTPEALHEVADVALCDARDALHRGDADEGLYLLELSKRIRRDARAREEVED